MLTGWFIIFLILIQNGISKLIEIQCPKHCKCDIFEKYRRATCVNKNLVAIEAFIPQETEILDLSYNQITEFPDHVFFEEKLLALKLLNVSHNKVGNIHFNAFDGLSELKTLDLSYNAMKYLLIHWFWSLSSLKELYLAGNSFGRFSDEPVIESKTLVILDISKCSISHLGIDVFAKIPSLEILDISGNFLIQLDVSVIRPLNNLNVLNINDNPFSCNNVMSQFFDFTVKKGIRCKDPCRKKPKEIDKFERIVMEPSLEQNSWIFDDEPIQNSTIIIDSCNTTKKAEQNLLMRIINLSPILSILIPFIYGIAIGILIGCTAQGRSFDRKQTQKEREENFEDNVSHLASSRRLSRFRRSISTFSKKDNSEIHETLLMSEWNQSESTPVTPRKFQNNFFDKV